MSGWIKLHRKLLAWEWYSKPVVKSVFIHSLLRANHKDGKWQGKEIKRGSFISSIDKLSTELGHSRQEIRTALKHLKSTNELTTIGNTQHTVFIVVNYESYQDETSELTNYQPTANQRLTTNKNDKNEDNEKKDNDLSKIDHKAVANIFNKYFCKGIDPITKELLLSSEIKQLTPKRKKIIDSFFNQTKLSIEKFEYYIEHVATNQNWAYLRKKNGKYSQRPFEFYMKLDNYVKASEEAENNE